MEPEELVRRLRGGPVGRDEYVAADGELIVREGDRDDRLFIVLDGEAVIETTAADADGHASRDVVDIIGPGGIFGELSFIDGRPRSASVRARGRVRAIVLSRAEFERKAATEPSQAVEFMSVLLGVLSGRVRESTRTMSALAETGRRLAAARGIDDIAGVVMARVTKSVPAATAGIVALVRAGGCEPVVGFGLPATLPVPLPLDPRGRFATALTAHPEGLTVGPDDDCAAELSVLGYRWTLVVGLFDKAALTGFVAVMSDEAQLPFTAQHQTALAIVGAQAAAALKAAERPRA